MSKYDIYKQQNYNETMKATVAMTTVHKQERPNLRSEEPYVGVCSALSDRMLSSLLSHWRNVSFLLHANKANKTQFV